MNSKSPYTSGQTQKPFNRTSQTRRATSEVREGAGSASNGQGNGHGQPTWHKALRRAAKWGYILRWRALPPDYNRSYRLISNGFEITVLPSVFHPKWHFTSEFLAETCTALIPGHGDCSVLEVGTGTGLVALSAARRAKN